MLASEKTYLVETCPHCSGTGLARNNRHFTYGVCLIAAGMLSLFQWSPTAGLVDYLRDLIASFSLSPTVGTFAVWMLVLIPALFGTVFLWLWIKADTCPTCNGRHKVMQQAPTVADWVAPGNTTPPPRP